MNIRLKTYYALNRISFLKHYALKHIVNSLNDGTYYVNINFNICLHNNNLFHIYILNEHAGEEDGSAVCSQLVQGTFNLI